MPKVLHLVAEAVLNPVVQQALLEISKVDGITAVELLEPLAAPDAEEEAADWLAVRDLRVFLLPSGLDGPGRSLSMSKEKFNRSQCANSACVAARDAGSPVSTSSGWLLKPSMVEAWRSVPRVDAPPSLC